MTFEARTFPPEQVILRLLQAVEAHGYGPVNRTHLVKLVYLTDYIYAQHTGSTLTGFRYSWDNYGPNALGNRIVKSADVLDSAGLISIHETYTPYGSSKFLYRIVEGVGVPPIDGLEERVIEEVARTYGAMDWKAVVEASKQTEPVLAASQGDILKFEGLRESTQAIFREIERRKREGRYRRGGKRLSLGGVKLRYNLAASSAT